MPRNPQLPEHITGQQIRGLSTNRDGCQQAVPILLISWILGTFLMRPIFFSFRVWHTVRMRHLKVSKSIVKGTFYGGEQRPIPTWRENQLCKHIHGCGKEQWSKCIPYSIAYKAGAGKKGNEPSYFG